MATKILEEFFPTFTSETTQKVIWNTTHSFLPNKFIEKDDKNLYRIVILRGTGEIKEVIAKEYLTAFEIGSSKYIFKVQTTGQYNAIQLEVGKNGQETEFFIRKSDVPFNEFHIQLDLQNRLQ